MILILYLNNAKDNKTRTVAHRLQWWYTTLGLDDYEIKCTNRKVKIGIIDTGIDGNHKDLVGQISDNFTVNEVISEKNFDYEHGTMVAGIIAAKPENITGIQGVNPYAEIVSIDISNDDKTCSAIG